jgi:predicted metalloprotease with PDZ domain
MSGLTVIAEGEELKKFMIADVREDSPGFNAGLRKEDYIEFINGVKHRKNGPE